MLWWKLLRGGGRPLVARLGLLVIGTAVGVTALLVALAIPRGLEAANGRVASRLPHEAAGEPGSFVANIVDDSVGTTILTRVYVAALVPSAPAPPGCRVVPAAGDGCASPALQALLTRRPALATRLATNVVETIAPSGLADPRELVVYEGSTSQQLENAGGFTADGYAAPDGGHSVGTSPRAVALEVILLAGIPAYLFLVTGARLSSASRRRTLDALAPLGLSRRELRVVVSAEGRIGGLLGSLVGVAAYAVVLPPLVRSGALGASFYAHDARVSAWEAIAVLAASTGALGVLARSVLAPARRRRTLPAWAGTLALVLGLGSLTGLAVRAAIAGSHRASVPFALLAVSAFLAVTGLLASLGPMTRRVAHVAAGRVRSTSALLGLRRLEHETGSATRVLGGLVAVVISGAVGTAVIHEVRVTDAPPSRFLEVAVAAGQLGGPAARDRATALGQEALLAEAQSRPTAAPGVPLSSDPLQAELQVGIPVEWASCHDLAAFLGTAELADCVDGRTYRVHPLGTADVSLLPVGAAIDIPTASGFERDTIPAADLAVPLTDVTTPNTLLFTSPRPAGGWAAAFQFDYLLPGDGHTFAGFQNAVAAIDPAVSVVQVNDNLPALRELRVHEGAVRAGVAIGSVLGIVAFVVASIDRLVERRRNVATLVALGVPLRTVRAAQATQLMCTLAVAMVPAVLTGYLVGVGYIAGGSTGSDPFYATGAVLAIVVVAAAAVLSLAASLPTYGAHLVAHTVRGE